MQAINQIMINKLFDSDSDNMLYHDSPKEKVQKEGVQKGGMDNSHDRPTGGFPPIFIIDDKEAEKTEKTKNRELTTIRSAISIKDILGKRKM
jgi:hypothetical protein